MMAEGALLGWYRKPLGAIIHFVVILVVYVLVWLFTLLFNKTIADNINKALKKYNDDEKDE